MVLLASCSTSSPLINWDSRIGNYTYDLALMDLGSPVRSATLPDGTLVVEWRVREAKSGTPDITNEGSYVPQSFADSPFPYATGPLPNRYLRLIFGRDQKLIGWERFQQYNL
ncbi:MAG: hypothetical protein JWR26_1824 [Pedosphaera sp.]|nr:hypothetical protein [Pedosphaera sp.]